MARHILFLEAQASLLQHTLLAKEWCKGTTLPCSMGQGTFHTTIAEACKTTEGHLGIEPTYFGWGESSLGLGLAAQCVKSFE